MRTLIEKELRENLRWLLVGLAIIGSLLWSAVPKSLAVEIRLTEHSIATMMFYGASVFAIGLGVMQSFADLRTASRSFLFHRSVSISTIFFSKLISGAIIYFIAVGLPLLVVAFWFHTQGIDYLPVRPLQVFPAAVVALACFGFHPAAMFMLARSGKWFGTKLLPLVYVIPLILPGLATSNTMMQGLAVNLLIVSTILVGILIVVKAARDAWVYSLADEGILPRHPAGFASVVTLSFAAVILLSASITFVSVWVDGNLRTDLSNVKEDYAIDADGNAWWAKSKRSRNDRQQTFVSGDRIRRDEAADVRQKLPENLNLNDPMSIFELRKPESCFEGENRFVARDRQTYFDSRGNVLFYDRTLRPPLQAIVSCEGNSFTGNPLRRAVSSMLRLTEEQEPFLWIDRKGFYGYIESKQKITTLLNMPIDAITSFHSMSTLHGRHIERMQLTVLSDGKLHVYRLTDPEGNEWVRNTTLLARADGAMGFAIKEIAVTPPLPPTNPVAIKFRVIGDSKFTVILSGPRPSLLTYDSELDSNWKSTHFMKPKNDAIADLSYLTFSLLPLLLLIILFVITVIGILVDGKLLPLIDVVSYYIQNEYPFVIFAIIVMLLSMHATIYACSRRNLSRSQTVHWCCWAVLLGWATPLAVLAIYTRPTSSRCTRCEKQRRIDLRICEHCGAEWEQPVPKGIEIFDEGVAIQACVT